MNRSTQTPLLLALLTLGLIVVAFGTVGSREVHRPKASKSRVTEQPGQLTASLRRLAEVDEHGSIPAGALEKAIAQKHALHANRPTSGLQWVEQGPSNLSGRACCLAISPMSPLAMWMGAAGGGVWRSYDGGTTWFAVGDQLKSLAVNALTLDPNDANTLYAGTGEGYYSSDAIGGYGIFRSRDGGTTWSQLPATVGFAHVNRIAVDPANSQILLATVEPGGIYRSQDGGATWSQVLSAQCGQSLAFCPSNTNRVVASIADFDNGSNEWLTSALVSNDAGKTWTKATGGLNGLVAKGRIELAPVVNDANTIYASVSDGKVWKSSNGGVNYLAVTSAGSSGATLNANAIWIDPTNSSHIVVGGQNIYASTDGGVTLSLIGQGKIQTSQPHPGVQAIVASTAYDGSTNKSVYVCTNGGVFQAPDITTASTGLGWISHYQGARTSQFNSVAGDGPTGRIVGGLADNGTQSMLMGLFQSNVIGSSDANDGGYVAIDPTDPQKFYGESGYLQVFQTTDGGLDVQPIVTGLTDATNRLCNYIAPLVIDPNQPSVLLAGGASLWRCSNAGAGAPTWSPIRPPDSDFISAIAVAPGNSDIIWVGQNDGTIAVTGNGTAAQPTWKLVAGPKTSSAIPNRFVTRILPDPSNLNVTYVTLGGFSSNNVWETIDSGTTWFSISGTGNSVLPQVPVRAIARKPGAPNSLYVGTEIGVFSSTDGGQTWTTASDLNANVSVDELAYMSHSNTLLAATHGRGIWLLPASSPTITSLQFNPSSVLGGTPCTGTVTLSQVAEAPGAVVTLSSNSSDAQVPATVTVPPGATNVTFPVTTIGVSGTETFTVSATMGASVKIATLTITPSILTSLKIQPSTLIGGNNATGTITLNGVAPKGGTLVDLTVNLPQVQTPAKVTVPAGSTSVDFPITTTGVAAPETVTVTAQQAFNTASATLTIQASTLQAVSVNPTSVAGGNPSVGTVTLDGKAPFGGSIVKLSSNSPSATVPKNVTIPYGSTSATFAISTSVVTRSTTATITSVLGNVDHSTTLQVVPTSLQSVSFLPSTVVGGSTTSVVGTVTFTGPTPPAGITVLLGSSTAKLGVPGSVKVLGGKSSATFVANHGRVNAAVVGAVTAKAGGVTQTGSLNLNPFQVSSINLTPSTVAGGSSSSGVVILNASPAAKTGAVQVKLTSDSDAVKPAASVNVFPKATSAKTTVVTHPVSTATTATVTASVDASNQTAALTVTPPTLVSVSVKPSTVKGSAPTPVTGTVTLSSPAPVGGLSVSLTSSNESAATVPLTILVPAGRLTGTFVVTHVKVTTSSTVTITASLRSTAKTTTVTVTP